MEDPKGLRLRMIKDGPCEECLIKVACDEICDDAWDFHLGELAKCIDPTASREVIQRSIEKRI